MDSIQHIIEYADESYWAEQKMKTGFASPNYPKHVAEEARHKGGIVRAAQLKKQHAAKEAARSKR
jgi:hypothetical protein